MKLTRRAKIALLLGTAFLVGEVTTYWVWAERAMPLAAIRQLRDYRLVKQCQFACVGEETWEALTQAQRSTLEAQLKRCIPVVYHSHDEIPDSAKIVVPITDKYRENYERNKTLSWVRAESLAQMRKVIEAGYLVEGYRGGTVLDWKLLARGPFWMKSQAQCWFSSAGAELRADVYVWVLGYWVKVWRLWGAMA